MKKIVLIAVLFISLNSFAQKTITIYNLSSTNFDIGEIDSKSTSVSTYPRFKSNYSNIIHIAAGTTYILTCSPASTTRFPFYSPTSVPQITSWLRQLTAGSTPSAITSSVASTTYGLTQYINFTKTQVGPNGSLGGGTLTPNVTNNFSDYYSYGTSPSAMVTLDVVSPLSPYYPSNTNNYDGETYIIITD